MKRFYLFLILLFSSICFADEYLIFAGEALLGKEEVIIINNIITTKTELTVSGQKLVFSQSLSLTNGKPFSYSANINNAVNITGTIKQDTATFTVANQSQSFRGKGLGFYPVENNTFYLWSYVLKDAPTQIIVPSQLRMVQATYSAWASGPFGTKVRQVNIGQLFLIGYFVDSDLVRLTIPLQNIDVVHKDWQNVFRETQTLSFKSEPVVLKRGPDLLHGELNIPENVAGFPVILLLSGSYPQDRDNNSPPEMTNSFFKHLSYYLTQIGFGTLRFDDRGMGKSTGDHLSQDFQTLVADAKAALAYLHKRPDVNQIGILGHSEGGIISVILAAQERDLAYCLLLATPSRNVFYILQEQITTQKSLPGLSLEQQKYLDDVLTVINKSLELAKKGAPTTPLGFSGAYLKQLLAIEPLSYAKQINCPVLILQGEADLKVLPYHAQELKNALLNASSLEVLTYPYLGHYFTPSPLNNPDFKLNEAFKIPDKVYTDIVKFLIANK